MSKKQGFTKADLERLGLTEVSPGQFKKAEKFQGIFPTASETENDGSFSKDHYNDLVNRKQAIFIPYQVPSKKNSQNIGRNPKTGRPLIYKSEQYRNYLAATKSYWTALKADFHNLIENKQKPYRIGISFVRSTRQRFDFIGPGETIQDFMVDFGWIDDDDARTMKPVFEDFGVDKQAPGVYIRIL